MGMGLETRARCSGMSDQRAGRPHRALRQRNRALWVLLLLVVWTGVQLGVYAWSLAKDFWVVWDHGPLPNLDFRWMGILMPLGMCVLALLVTLPIQKRLGLRWRWRVGAGVTSLLGFLIFPYTKTVLSLFLAALLFFLVPPLAGILVTAWRKGWMVIGLAWLAMLLVFVAEPYYMAGLWHWWY